MRIYDFWLRVAVPEGADEATLIERVKDLTASLEGDPTDGGNDPRPEAKVTLTALTLAGGNPTDRLGFAKEACSLIPKKDPTDWFLDQRPKD